MGFSAGSRYARSTVVEIPPIAKKWQHKIAQSKRYIWNVLLFRSKDLSVCDTFRVFLYHNSVKTIYFLSK